MMKLPVLQTLALHDLQQFINYWSKFYYDNLEYLYNEHIQLSNYEEEDIQALFKWKNGMNLSEFKQKSLGEKILSKIGVIKEMKESDLVNETEFLEVFRNVSAVWKIFLLHIIKPNQYPIYDQNIHRAYNYIHGLEYSNVSASSLSDKKKEDFYFHSYLKFAKEHKVVDLKKIDEALFVFGKFLKIANYSGIITSEHKNT